MSKGEGRGLGERNSETLEIIVETKGNRSLQKRDG